MPTIQEFAVHDPTMMSDRFFVEIPAGETWQAWRQEVSHGDRLEVFCEEEQRWLVATVHTWRIEDGSGNAPGASAHVFLVIRRGIKVFKLDLCEGLRVRLEAPTSEELKSRPKWCEGSELEEVGTGYHPDVWGPCLAPASQKVGEGWYCDTHARQFAPLLHQRG